MKRRTHSNGVYFDRSTKGEVGKKKADGFADLAAAFAKVYNIENAEEVFDGAYEDQVRNPAFIGMLLYNCMVMNALYGCRRGGCDGCRARALFDRVEDPETKAKITKTMGAMDTVDGAERMQGEAAR